MEERGMYYIFSQVLYFACREAICKLEWALNVNIYLQYSINKVKYFNKHLHRNV